jgi:putative transposase
MPRAPRLIMDNASYHIIARGNQKQHTFLEEEDFVKYLDLLRHYKRKYNFRLYGYCLMPNHIHLILEIKSGSDLGKLMQGLNQTYTIWFNEKYKKVGHLWQGRYKSMIIEKDRYMFACIEYVELNPLRANIVKSPFDYPWNSWQVRFGYKKDSLLDIPVLT